MATRAYLLSTVEFGVKLYDPLLISLDNLEMFLAIFSKNTAAGACLLGMIKFRV